MPGGRRAPAAGGSPSDREERWSLGASAAAVAARLKTWSDGDVVSRFWRKDPTFWPASPPADVAGRLGWLRAPEQSAARLAEWRTFAREVADDGFARVVLLGMGGSSLAPEVIASVLPSGRGAPAFSVLDSTHPRAVRACLEQAPVERTLYLVSSKSGSTLEPNAFFRFFWEGARSVTGGPGRHFVAITDPGTALERLAAERHFRACFAAPADVGGRYSALTVFGLVPAALLGVDLEGLLGSARGMVARCAAPTDASLHPGLRLGAALGELALAGRNKVVFLTSPSLRPFPAWVEQLIAESLGKLGRGIVPVADPPPTGEFPKGADVVYVRLELEGEREPAIARALETEEARGTPVLRFLLASPLDLGREFFRWEFAIAATGAVLGVDPFDQPDVERAKALARSEMEHSAGPGPGPYGIPAGTGLPQAVERWIASGQAGDYVAVQAFLAPEERTEGALRRLLSELRLRLGVPVTLGYGPRFLHSTGQMHKGGPPTALFLQLVDEPDTDLPVPELGLSFREIIRAQAEGDRAALEERQRRLLVVNVGARPLEGLAALADAVHRRPTASPRAG